MIKSLCEHPEGYVDWNCSSCRDALLAQRDRYRLALEDIAKFAVKDRTPARCEAVAKGALNIAENASGAKKS